MLSRRDVFKRAALLGAAVAAAPLLPGDSVSNFKLGKLPAVPRAYKLRLTDYTTSAFHAAPPAFGHYKEVPSAWGMLANDKYGCCVWAGAAHEHLLWTSEAGCAAPFTNANVLSAYSAVTGFDQFKDTPAGNSTDQGTSVADALAYRRTTGLTDATGKIHKLAAWAEIEVQNLDLNLLASAAWLLSAVGVGIEFPSTAMAQTNRGVPWDYIPGSATEGGHYVPIVGRLANGNFLCITWGQLQEITPRFLSRYCDEAVALFSTDFLVAGKSPEGLDAPSLFADFSLT